MLRVDFRYKYCGSVGRKPHRELQTLHCVHRCREECQFCMQSTVFSSTPLIPSKPCVSLFASKLVYIRIYLHDAHHTDRVAGERPICLFSVIIADLANMIFFFAVFCCHLKFQFRLHITWNGSIVWHDTHFGIDFAEFLYLLVTRLATAGHVQYGI